MNGLVHENILFSAPPGWTKTMLAFGIDWDLCFRYTCKGYVSRKKSAHFLFGWSPRHRMWYYLCPRWDSTSYCYRFYFRLFDKLQNRILTIDDLSFVKVALNADIFIGE